MTPTAITPEALKAWSSDYENSPERQVATLALAKTDINSVNYVARASFAMRH